jgi:hypothetical protein
VVVRLAASLIFLVKKLRNVVGPFEAVGSPLCLFAFDGMIPMGGMVTTKRDTPTG